MQNSGYKKSVELTTLQITKGLRDMVRVEADLRGMKMAAFAQRLVKEALDGLDNGMLMVPSILADARNGSGGKISKRNTSSNSNQKGKR